MGKMLNPEVHLPNSAEAEVQKPDRAAVEADIAELESQIAEVKRIQAEKNTSLFSAEERMIVGKLGQIEEELGQKRGEYEALLKEEGGEASENAADILAAAPKREVLPETESKPEAPDPLAREKELEKTILSFTEGGEGTSGGIKEFFKAQKELNELRAVREKAEAEAAKPPLKQEEVEYNLAMLFDRLAALEAGPRTLEQDKNIELTKSSIAFFQKQRAEIVGKNEVEESDEEFMARHEREEREIRDGEIASIEKKLGSANKILLWRNGGSLEEKLAELNKDKVKAEAEKSEGREKEEIELLKIAEKQGQKIKEKAEALGWGERIRNAGRWYKKQSFKAKMGASLALFGAAAGAAAIGGTLGTTIGFGAAFLKGTQRVLSGIGTAVSVEALLKSRVEQGEGREQTLWESRRHTAEAVLAGVLVGSGAVGEALKNGMSAFHEFLGEYFADPEITTNVPLELGENFGNGVAGASAEVYVEEAQKAAAEVMEATPDAMVDSGLEATGDALANTKLEGAVAAFDVKNGDNLWSLMKKGLGGVLDGKTPQQQNFITDSLYKKIAHLGEADIKALGIESGDPAIVRPGDHIDLTRLYAGQLDSAGEKTVGQIFGDAESVSEKVVNLGSRGFVGEVNPDSGVSAPAGAGAEIFKESTSDEVSNELAREKLRQGIRDSIDRNSGSSFVNNKK